MKGLFVVQVWDGEVWAITWYGHSLAEGLLQQQRREYNTMCKPAKLLVLRIDEIEETDDAGIRSRIGR